jgi:citrate lyase subunit beta / citryl-CoA lyase
VAAISREFGNSFSLPRRSQLFVPGLDEAKIKKALTLPCDSIIFDLEDSVPDSEKGRARKVLARMLEDLHWEKEKKKELCVRINPLGTRDSEKDIEQFGRKNDRIVSLVVPKCEKPLTDLAKVVSSKNFIPILETARGFLALEEIARSERVVALAYGAADFANSLGGKTAAFHNNIYVKTAISIACSAYGVEPIDCVFFNFNDLDGFRKEAAIARELGYKGKQLIHPGQIEAANEIFSPSREEIERARRVVELYESQALSGRGAMSMDGELVDAVHYRWAKSVVDCAPNEWTTKVDA